MFAVLVVNSTLLAPESADSEVWAHTVSRARGLPFDGGESHGNFRWVIDQHWITERPRILCFLGLSAISGIRSGVS